MKSKLTIEKYLDRLLKTRLRSQFEIEQKLKQKKYLPKEIQKAIEVLKKDNLINDKRFAYAFVHDREILNPRGKRLLALELRHKGITSEIIEEVLSFDDRHELELACQALGRKKRSYQNLDQFERKKKLLGFLSRRGFSYGISKAAIEKRFKSC